uniref:5-formyltetrahydrofolate cyclo-ligase n=1 Tax=Astyanax mexicanus TaxID=7994 RepID=A0A8B9KK69_ASTMX
MAALRAAKQALRKEIKKRVATLSEEEKLRQSLLVSQKLFEHPRYKSSQRVAVFLSMSDEVRTEAIVQHMFSSGKVCFIPKYLSNSSHMDMLRLNSLEDISSLPLTSWNIRQPGENDTEREEALDTGGSFMNKSSGRLVSSLVNECWRCPGAVRVPDRGSPRPRALLFASVGS